MANVSHASLTGSNLHEPKGADTATLGTVYVSNGAGSGTWSSVGTSAFTGMIADFAAPVAPAGWLELDGSVISTSTYAALFGVMSITTSGTRTNGSPIITSIPSTANLRAGYFVFGTGITSGSTIVTVDSGTQITISIAATSSGSSTFQVSPWLLNTGTIQLPDLTTAGRYRRSRSSTTTVGQLQASQNLAHTHTGTGSVTGTTNDPGNHTHINTLTDPGHFHTASDTNQTGNGAFPCAGGGSITNTIVTTTNTTGISINNAAAGAHTHTVTGTATFTTDSTGATETRPVSLVVLTCVKT
jgi:microcystin-dependent protein